MKVFVGGSGGEVAEGREASGGEVGDVRFGEELGGVESLREDELEGVMQDGRLEEECRALGDFGGIFEGGAAQCKKVRVLKKRQLALGERMLQRESCF